MEKNGGLMAVVGLMWMGACGGSPQAQRYESVNETLAELETASRVPEDAQDQDVDGAAIFAGATELDRAMLVRAVLARNPDVEAARQAWRAARERYEQSGTLPDPMAEYAFAPLSIASDMRFGQQITLSQRIPWPGKLSARADVALHEAEAAAAQYETARLELALGASTLFDAYYANRQSLSLLEEHQALVEDIRAAAHAQYAAGLASQQDPLQAEVELAHIEHRRVQLTAERQVLVAQMNALLHRGPEEPLPPAPASLSIDLPDVPTSQALQQQAIAHRPELRAIAARLRARRAAVSAAEQEYWPDFGVMGSYNTMWPELEHQIMVGVSVEIPLQLGRRGAAVAEAEAEHAAELARAASLVAEIRAEVETARQRVIEARHIVSLYRERLLPIARQQIEAARIAYATGRGGFQSLVDAERSVRSLELTYEEASAALQQRSAELQRRMGITPGLPREEEGR